MTKATPKKDEWARLPDFPKYMWLSGDLIEWDKATIHASMLGWSSISMVFEGIRGYWDPTNEQLDVFQLQNHL